MTDRSESTEPPRPPRVQRRVHLSGAQWIGIPLLMLLPVLAILGLFDATHRTVSARGDGVELAVEYPARMRYQQTGHVMVEIRNATGTPLPEVRLTFDSVYARRFSELRYTPPGNTAHEVAFASLEPGASATVRVDLRAESYWRQRGNVRLLRGTGDSLNVTFTTFVLP